MDHVWLKEQFEKNPRLNKAGLARALGLEPSAISKILANTRQIKAQEYLGMLEYFGLPEQKAASHGTHALHETAPVQVDWEIPEQASNHFDKPFPKRGRPYYVSYDTGSVRFCRGDTLLLDPDQDVMERELPFVVILNGSEILAMCRLDGSGQIYVQPLGGRMASVRVEPGAFECLGYIYAKMEIL